MKGKIFKSDEEWRKQLSPEVYRVTRQGNTECAFSGQYYNFKGKGVFKCVCCGNELFLSDGKFDSGTGWPSFWKPYSESSIETVIDFSHGLVRQEVRCAQCDAHLGHVFEDGPPPTGLRYCINSLALVFSEHHDETATFAAGCFWGVEHVFSELEGIKSTRTGYTGGITANPTYRDVCSNKTGHAEAVEIVFNPELISYEKLLDIFWQIHDPCSLNRQGLDFGTQYRSAIFYHSEEQRLKAMESKEKLEKSGKYRKPIVTEITRAGIFYPAEEYHQQYIKKHGQHACSP